MECRVLWYGTDDHGEREIILCAGRRYHLKFNVAGGDNAPKDLEHWTERRVRWYGEWEGSEWKGGGDDDLSNHITPQPCTCDEPQTLPPFLERFVEKSLGR